MSLVTNKIFFYSFFTVDQNVSANSSSPCKDWEPYKDEKCFKIFENVGLHTYQNAQYVCNQQNSAKLVSIRSLEEQMFFSNLLFKTHKVVDNVWIEAKYSSNKFKWADDSDVSFTNWAEGSPSNTVDKACVQMIPDGSLMGKWVDKPCNKKNLVVCQKMQPWSISQLQNTLLNVRKEFKDYKDVSDKKLNNLQQNPVPIGFIYVQLPSQPEPKDLWPTVDWKEVTSDYAGLFFRVLGGGSATFEQIQEENSPRVSKVQNSNLVELNQVKEDSSLSLPTGVWSNKIWTGQAPGHGSNIFLRFSVSDGEVRPRNRAMRIWKRSK
jgi:hypothetical protein